MASKYEYSAELFRDMGNPEAEDYDGNCGPIANGPWVSTSRKAIQWAEKQTGWDWANINVRLRATRKYDNHSWGEVAAIIYSSPSQPPLPH